MNSISKLFFGGSLLLGLSACASLKVPLSDFINTPEIRKDAKNIGKYPKPEEQPQKPGNLRSDVQWDMAAKSLEQKGESLNPPAEHDKQSKAEIEKKLLELAAKVDEYKKDDPE